MIGAHGRVEFHSPIFQRELSPAVECDLEFRCVAILAAGHLHGVFARQNSRSLTRFKRRRSRWWNSRSFQPHRPLYAADASPVIRRQGIDELSLRIEHFDLHTPENMTLLLIVGNPRRVRWVRPNKGCISFRPPAIRVEPLLRRLTRQKHSFLRHYFRREFPQGRDVVDNPNPTSMRCQDKIRLPRMNNDVPDRHLGKISALVLGPLLAAVRRNPKPELSTQK